MMRVLNTDGSRRKERVTLRFNTSDLMILSRRMQGILKVLQVCKRLTRGAAMLLIVLLGSIEGEIRRGQT
jgi:hypothetical protein